MEQDNTLETESKKGGNEAWEWTKALLVAAGLVIVIRWLLFAPFIVEGSSMHPNFETGERLIVNKLIYRFAEPKRGEVIVFHANEYKDYIKRVIALPGETIRIEDDLVYVNGEPIDEPYLKEVLEQAAKLGVPYNNKGVYVENIVPENTVFVLGDNRSDSTDSRMIGVVSYDEIVGRADLKFWPIGSFGLVK